MMKRTKSRFRAMTSQNTRREVIRHPDLLSYEDEEKQVMHISEQGAAYLGAFMRAGGFRPR